MNFRVATVAGIALLTATFASSQSKQSESSVLVGSVVAYESTLTDIGNFIHERTTRFIVKPNESNLGPYVLIELKYFDDQFPLPRDIVKKPKKPFSFQVVRNTGCDGVWNSSESLSKESVENGGIRRWIIVRNREVGAADSKSLPCYIMRSSNPAR